MLYPAPLSDLLIIEALYKRTIQDLNSRGLFQWNEAYPNRSTFERAIMAQSMYLFKDSDQLLGAVILDENQSEEWRSVDWQLIEGRILVIHALVIDPAIQSKGLGRELLSLCEQYAFDNSYTIIRLDAFAENKPVLRFYERAGYRKVGTVWFPYKPQGYEWYDCFEKGIEKG